MSPISRRDLIRYSAAAGAGLLLPPALWPDFAAAQERGNGVAMFRGNPARTGVLPGPGPDLAAGLEVVWSFDTGSEYGIQSTALVADGVVYIGDFDTTLYALDAATGGERWRFTVGGGLYATPALHDGVLYAPSWDGTVYALDAATGGELWRFTTGSGSAFLASPVVEDGVIYAANAKLEGEAIATNVFALNARDGTERWRFGVGSMGYLASPVLADGTLYVADLGDPDAGSISGIVNALDAHDGNERWRTGLAGLTLASGGAALSEDNQLIVAGMGFPGSGTENPTGVVFGLDAREGGERWRYLFASRQLACPAMSDGVVVVTGSDGGVFAVASGDGSELWRATLGDRNLSPWSSIVDGVVYVASYSGTIHMLRLEDGSELFRYVLSELALGSPIVANGMIYIGGEEGVFYAVGARAPRLEAGGTARARRRTPVRGAPSPVGVERAELREGDEVAITGEAVEAGGAIWWPVTVTASGAQGWVDAEDLEPLTRAPESN